MQNSDKINDDSIRGLFEALPPRSGDSDSFMNGLSRRIDAIDTVRQTERRKVHAMRLALCMAILAGFAAGVACTLLMPSLTGAVKACADALAGAIPALHMSDTAILTVTWLLAGALSLGIATETFGITRALATEERGSRHN